MFHLYTKQENNRLRNRKECDTNKKKELFF